jgi:tRNA (adenine22-N1)-methyltransferase
VQAGICPRALAGDIREGPLANARKTVEAAGLQHQIALRLSDGFSCFAPEDASVWILAGMGGTLMVRLLDAAPWLCAPGTTLVCQPMRHAWELRAWLCSHGFCINEEQACHDAGRPYHALRAVFGTQNTDRPQGIGYAYYGELPQCRHPAAQEILAREQRLLQTRAAALKKNGQPNKNLTKILLDFNEGEP